MHQMSRQNDRAKENTDPVSLKGDLFDRFVDVLQIETILLINRLLQLLSHILCTLRF
jgi:hypothetical protein